PPFAKITPPLPSARPPPSSTIIPPAPPPPPPARSVEPPRPPAPDALILALIEIAVFATIATAPPPAPPAPAVAPPVIVLPLPPGQPPRSWAGKLVTAV